MSSGVVYSIFFMKVKQCFRATMKVSGHSVVHSGESWCIFTPNAQRINDLDRGRNTTALELHVVTKRLNL